MNNLLLSIIVPIYNIEEYLEECLESIEPLLSDNVEVILVNDGSTDNCPQICERFCGSHSNNVYVINQSNEGLLNARKNGVIASVGEYVTFIDGDDYLDGNYIGELATIICDYHPDIIATSYKRISMEKKDIYTYSFDGLYEKDKLVNEVYPVMIMDNDLKPKVVPSIWSKVIRRELLLSVIQAVDTSITDGEDCAVVYPCIYMASSVFFTNAITNYCYRVNDASMTHRYNPIWVENSDRYLKWMHLFFDKHEDALIDKQLEASALYMFYRYYIREINHCISNGIDVKKRFDDIFKNTYIGTVFKNCKIEEFNLQKIDYVLLRLTRMKLFGPFKIKRLMGL